MRRITWNKNLLGRTRWKLISLLRLKKRGVSELAEALDVTANAIRPHLVTLERDGLVRQTGIRQSGGKPAHIFELTEEAEQLFPKAYGIVLRQLLKVMSERFEKGEVEDLMREVGRGLAAMFPTATGDREARLKRAVETIDRLGGLAELVREEGEWVIQGRGCPLVTAAAGNPEACMLAETLLAELTGLPIREFCEKGDKVRCFFKVQDS